MSFAFPLALLALLAIPALIVWYGRHQRRRSEAAAAFADPSLSPSYAPWSPGWRRHTPMLILVIAALVLIIAAARPQRTVAVPITDGAVMLVNDVSSSMLATDVTPNRLAAARSAETRFLQHVPNTIQVGLVEFARHPVLLQSPTTNHALTQTALGQFQTGGGTAMGEALQTALRVLAATRSLGGHRPPGAIVLLSDGASNVGVSPLQVARQAATQHVPVYTVSLGTSHGTIPIRKGSTVEQVPVPVSPQELGQIAQLSRGHAFTAGDAQDLSSVYEGLAAKLGHRQVRQEITQDFAGGGLVLLLLAALLSLFWFGRLI